VENHQVDPRNECVIESGHHPINKNEFSLRSGKIVRQTKQRAVKSSGEKHSLNCLQRKSADVKKCRECPTRYKNAELKKASPLIKNVVLIKRIKTQDYTLPGTNNMGK
jgi:hypothetical protein